MKTTWGRIAGLSVWGVLTMGILVLAATSKEPMRADALRPISAAARLPLELDKKLSLAIQSDGIEWRSNTYHLVTLGTIQFELNPETNRLKAFLQATLTCFDDVDYDISGAVFDERGELLGAGRVRCHVDRVWLGNLPNLDQSLTLDFGISLDYQRAKTFSLSISKRKVLTPDEWQKTN